MHGEAVNLKTIDCSCTCTCTHTHAHTQFEKGWVLKNIGTKKWKHVCLVHQEGFKPCTPEIVMPELKPGEKVEVRVRYPAVESQDPDYIKRYTWSVHLSVRPSIRVSDFISPLSLFSAQLLEANPQRYYSLWTHPLALCAGGQEAVQL